MGAAPPILPPPATVARLLTTLTTLPATSPHDSLSTLLELVATPQIRQLLESIEAHRGPQNFAQLDHLLDTATKAIEQHDLPRALTALTEYVRQNPDQTQALLASPSLASIQPELKDLLHHITQDAKHNAEHLLETATLAVDGAEKHPPDLYGPDALLLARRLAESGQLSNYFRSAEISQAVMAFYPVAEGRRRTALPAQPPTRRLEFPKWMGSLWRRAPLLALLLGWLALGVPLFVASRLADPSTLQFAFEVWGLGFPALVVLQFLLSIRGARFWKKIS